MVFSWDFMTYDMENFIECKVDCLFIGTWKSRLACLIGIKKN